MLKNLFILLIFLWTIVPYSLSAQYLSKVGYGYSETSVNTAVFRNSAVVTDGKTQYISFYDKDGFLVLGKRKLGSDQWSLCQSKYKGNVKDAHNVISMAVDGEGYLHVAFDHHNHPLNYCKSTAPGSLTLGPKTVMTEEEHKVTYPEFYRLPDGRLLFAYRSGASGEGNLVLNRYDIKSQQWEKIQNILIDGENQRNAYWQLYVDTKGIIHLSWVWRETPQVETNHDLCYARSRDGGKTWEKSNGELYQLPIRLANTEYACRIPQNSELINQTSMSSDRKGHPYIASYWRDTTSNIPQYRLVWHDGKEWHTTIVFQRETPFSLKGGGTKMIPIARPRLAIQKHKIYYLFRDAERDYKVSLAYTSDIRKGQWTIKDLTDFPVHAWEPCTDTELWKKKKKLHLFVQNTYQGDGEKTVNAVPQPIYVLEVKR